MHHHLRWFLRKILPLWIDHVDESGISQILNVVHHGCPTCIDAFGQLAHIGSLGAFDSQLVEQAFYFWQILQFYLLDEEDVIMFIVFSRFSVKLRCSKKNG